MVDVCDTLGLAIEHTPEEEKKGSLFEGSLPDPRSVLVQALWLPCACSRFLWPQASR
jgi:hypothetical protein